MKARLDHSPGPVAAEHHDDDRLAARVSLPALINAQETPMTAWT